MAVDRIWVVAEAFEGKALSITLELLTAARGLAGTVEAVAWGADVASYAPQLGEYGATKVYDVGDTGSQLPGVPVGAAIAALIQLRHMRGSIPMVFQEPYASLTPLSPR